MCISKFLLPPSYSSVPDFVWFDVFQRFFFEVSVVLFIEMFWFFKYVLSLLGLQSRTSVCDSCENKMQDILRKGVGKALLSYRKCTFDNLKIMEKNIINEIVIFWKKIYYFFKFLWRIYSRIYQDSEIYYLRI